MCFLFPFLVLICVYKRNSFCTGFYEFECSFNCNSVLSKGIILCVQSSSQEYHDKGILTLLASNSQDTDSFLLHLKYLPGLPPPAFCSINYTSLAWCFQLSVPFTIPVWLDASRYLFQLLYQSGMVLPAFCSSSYTSFDWCFQLSILVTIPVWLGASSFLFQLLYQSGLVLPAFCSIYYTSLAWCFQLSVLVTVPVLTGASSFLFHLLYQSGFGPPAFCFIYMPFRHGASRFEHLQLIH